MKITIASSLLTGVAAVALLLGACSKHNDSISNPVEGTDARAVLATCTLKDTTVTSTGTNFNFYSAWTPATVTLAGGTGLQVKFEGFSNSFIRPLNAGFYVGTVAFSDTCATWSSLRTRITVKNAHLGAAPDTAGYPKFNVVGIHGSFAGVAYNSGFYQYVTGVPTVDSAVVIWKDFHGTTNFFNSNPATLVSPEAYIIRVRSFAVGGAAGAYTSAVAYGYKRI